MTTPDAIAARAAVATTVPADRLRGLPANVAELLRQSAQQMRAGQLHDADRSLISAESLVPNQPEVRRTRALWLARAGRRGEARRLVEELVCAHPDDATLWNDLGGTRRDCGDREGALAAWRRACDLKPDFAIAWLNLAMNLAAQAWISQSLPAFERALALAPDHVVARIMYADCLVAAGKFERARAQYLDMLRRAPTNGAAWWGLASIKTVRLTDAETARLTELLQRTDVVEFERAAMGFSLAKACEDRDRFDEAFAALDEANARMRKLRPWSAARFSATVAVTLAAFTRAHSQASDATLGKEIIFIVSLPRAGSTLTEQILAAHAEVEGASELTDLSAIVSGESERRGCVFPLWVADATPDDWTRLGRDYLRRTARWREQRPRSTDKMPDNWLFIGVIQAMLPGARIVDVRRDPVETCWSCYKQLFSRGTEFCYDFADLAAYWRDYDHAMRCWHALTPERIREQSYEALVADSEREIRALLQFCDLPFDPACLRAHEVERSVRTASAAQVREPIRAGTARAAKYGALLDPLRQALQAAIADR